MNKINVSYSIENENSLGHLIVSVLLKDLVEFAHNSCPITEHNKRGPKISEKLT